MTLRIKTFPSEFYSGSVKSDCAKVFENLVVMKASHKSIISQSVGVLTSIVALIWLAQLYDIKDLTEPLGSADYRYVLLAVSISILDYILRSLRWRLLFLEHEPKSFINVFRALMQGYLFNMLLPARAGELVRIHRLGKDEGISRGAVLGTVVVERVGDVTVLMMLLTAAFVFYPNIPEWFYYTGWLMAFIAVVATAVLAAIHFHGHRLKPAFTSLFSRFLAGNLLLKLKNSGSMFIEGLAGLFRVKSIVLFLIITMLLWAFAVLVAYYVSGSLGLWMNPVDLLFVMLVISAGTMIPSSPGYIGVYELVGVAGLELVGISGGVALSFIVMLHAVTILVPSVIGSLCLLKRTEKSPVISEQGYGKE